MEQFWINFPHLLKKRFEWQLKPNIHTRRQVVNMKIGIAAAKSVFEECLYRFFLFSSSLICALQTCQRRPRGRKRRFQLDINRQWISFQWSTKGSLVNDDVAYYSPRWCFNNSEFSSLNHCVRVIIAVSEQLSTQIIVRNSISSKSDIKLGWFPYVSGDNNQAFSPTIWTRKPWWIYYHVKNNVSLYDQNVTTNRTEYGNQFKMLCANQCSITVACRYPMYCFNMYLLPRLPSALLLL